MIDIFQWKNKPRIVTYPNPCTINNNYELMKMLNRYPHLCASDTLLMGLTHKYGRSNFTFLCTVDKFEDYLFNRFFSNKENDLQMFVDITASISEIQNEDKVAYRALMNNRGQLVEAFRMLTLLQFECMEVPTNKEQAIFFDKVYSPLSKRYIRKIQELEASVSLDGCRSAYIECLIDEIQYNFKSLENERDLKKITSALQDMLEKEKASQYLSILEGMSKYDLNTVVIHGVARFTPEIMMLIKTLDDIGINIIFMINYADNLPGIYSLWKKTYEWVGVPFEFVSNIDLSLGNTVGKCIAEICEGIRPKEAAHASIIKYSTITDFTDGPVRREFNKAEEKAKKIDSQSTNILAHMRTQYYAVSADKANDILRNYFPDQFIDKPFLSYPIGQFIKALFEMWDFNKWEMKVDFNLLKECAAVRISHNNDNMVQIIENLQLYFKDITSVADVDSRLENLINQMNSFDNEKKRIFGYLSYYSIEKENIRDFQRYVKELNGIASEIFGSDSAKTIDYQSKFKDLISIVGDNVASENALSIREDELIQSLIKTLSLARSNTVIGGIKELKDALNFFLSVKRSYSGADWIVRGFDQIDGAPIMSIPPGRIYEFAMMSMKNMTKTSRDILPWPLTEKIFNGEVGLSLYLNQVQNMVELRNEYLRFYFFYGAFFSKGAQIKFSYIENENDEKQYPYYLLDLLGLPIETTKESKKRIKYLVKEEKDLLKQEKRTFSERELNIFSICPYKYFLTYILNNRLKYTSEYHTNYFIENEIVNILEIECNNNKSQIDTVLPKLLEYIKGVCPYMDEATISDMEKYARKNFSDKKTQNCEYKERYLQKKRDFLIAIWKDLEKNKDYMKYDKTGSDIIAYMESSKLFPSGSDIPHEKVCEECNYNELCLNYYLDKGENL